MPMDGRPESIHVNHGYPQTDWEVDHHNRYADRVRKYNGVVRVHIRCVERGLGDTAAKGGEEEDMSATRVRRQKSGPLLIVEIMARTAQAAFYTAAILRAYFDF